MSHIHIEEVAKKLRHQTGIKASFEAIERFASFSDTTIRSEFEGEFDFAEAIRRTKEDIQIVEISRESRRRILQLWKLGTTKAVKAKRRFAKGEVVCVIGPVVCLREESKDINLSSETYFSEVCLQGQSFIWSPLLKDHPLNAASFVPDKRSFAEKDYETNLDYFIVYPKIEIEGTTLTIPLPIYVAEHDIECGEYLVCELNQEFFHNPNVFASNLAALFAEYNDREKEIKKLELLNFQMRKHLTADKNLKDKVEQLESIVSKKEKELAFCNQLVTEKNQIIKKYEKKINRKRQRIQELKQLQEKISDLETQLTKSQQAEKNSQAEIAILTEKLNQRTTSNADLDTLKQELEQGRIENDHLQVELQDMQLSQKDFIQQIADLSEEKNFLASQLEHHTNPNVLLAKDLEIQTCRETIQLIRQKLSTVSSNQEEQEQAMHYRQEIYALKQQCAMLQRIIENNMRQPTIE